MVLNDIIEQAAIDRTQPKEPNERGMKFTNASFHLCVLLIDY